MTRRQLNAFKESVAIASCIIILLVGVPLAVVSVATGCATTQQADSQPAITNERYSETQRLYTSALRVALDARASGLITQEKWEAEYLPIIDRGDVILDQLNTARVQGLDTFETLRSALLIVVIELEAL